MAGKTGTAQKLDPATRRYSRAPGVLSFVGFAPADEPRLAMLVMLDEPKNEKWGSEAAAPIFAAIGREVLRYLDVPPRDAAPVPIVHGGRAASAAPRAARAARPPHARPASRSRDGRGVMPRPARPDAAPGAGGARAARRAASRWHGPRASSSAQTPAARRAARHARRPASRLDPGRRRPRDREHARGMTCRVHATLLDALPEQDGARRAAARRVTGLPPTRARSSPASCFVAVPGFKQDGAALRPRRGRARRRGSW